MNRFILSGLSLLGVALATWASQRDRPDDSDGPAAARVPAYFGPIHPRLSADGREFAFSFQGAIWRLPREGGTMTRLTSGAGFDIEPVWSHDGARIAYLNSPRMADAAVQVIRSDTGEPTPNAVRLEVASTVVYAKLEFHPDGRLLGHLRVDGQDRGLCLVDPASGRTEPLVQPPRQSRWALSRDGNWLAYTGVMDVDGQQSGNDGPQADVWKVATGGGEPVKITRFPSRIYDVCWSADGKALFVVSELGGAHYDLWRVPVDDPDRGARRITTGQADEDRPSVSDDGRWLAYVDNREGATALVARDLSTGVDATVPVRGMDYRQPTGTLTVKARDKQTGAPVVARVSIVQEDGKYFAPVGALHRIVNEYGHFYCDREARLVLPAGTYRLRAFRGPEYRVVHRNFEIQPGGDRQIALELERWTNAAERGWHSGENHIHANYGYGQWYSTPETMLQQCAGEDLRVCNFMVANSDTDGVFDREWFRGRPDPLSTPDTILYWNQEFRSTLWGHMTLVNLSQVVEPVFTGFRDTTNPWDVPTNSDIADRTHIQRGLVNYTHATQNRDDPYRGAYTAKGLPVDVALGKIDTLDINYSYAGTTPVWYRLLNCGFRLPASAGTDVFLNRINSRLPGQDRVYVRIDGPFNYTAWIDGLRAGRSFVSNGPMLELSAETSQPGDTVRLAAPREVRIVCRALSQYPLERVELVYNGVVAAAARLSDDKLSGEIDALLNLPRSGWLSLRTAGTNHPDRTGGPLEAHTSPIYVEVAGRPAASRADAEYFLKWIDRLSLDLRLRDRAPVPELKRHIRDQLEAARAVYARIAENAD